MKFCDLLTRAILLFTLIIMGGGSAMADRLAPTFVTEKDVAHHWYQLFFVNQGGNWGYVFRNETDGRMLRTQNGTAGTTTNYFWQFVGSENDFVLVNYEGYYARWDNPRYTTTNNKSEATHLQLVANTNGAQDCWGFKRLNGQFWNPQSGDGQHQIREYSQNDGGARIRLVPQDVSAFAPLQPKDPATYTNFENGWYAITVASAGGDPDLANAVTAGRNAIVPNPVPANMQLEGSLYGLDIVAPNDDPGKNLVRITKEGNSFYLQSLFGLWFNGNNQAQYAKAAEATPTINGNLSSVRFGMWHSFHSGAAIGYNSNSNVFTFTPYLLDSELTDGSAAVTVYRVESSGMAVPSYNASQTANNRNSLPTVTCTNASVLRSEATVGLGGYYIFSSDYVPTATDFTASGIGLDAYEVVVSGTGPVKTLRFQSADTGIPWRVIITGANRPDEQITYQNNRSFVNRQESKLANGAATATVRNGESFYFKTGLTRQELLDCDFTSFSPTRASGKTSFVWGPVIDMEAHTITCEVREAVSSLPETGWYQLKYDVSTNNVNASTRHSTGSREDGFTNPVRQNNRFYLTMPRDGNVGNPSEYTNLSTYPTDDTTPLTFVKLVRSGNGLMMMTVDGRYLQDSGTPSTNGSGFVNNANYIEGTVDFLNWFPFGDRASFMIGRASNTHNYFYTAPARFDDERYEFYEVHIEAEQIDNDARVTYTGSAKNYNRNVVYRNGLFVFPKGTVPTINDFEVTGATFGDGPLILDIEDAGDYKTMTIRTQMPLMGANVRVSVVATDGTEVQDVVAYFDTPNGTRMELVQGQTYNLSQYEFLPHRFSLPEDQKLINVTYRDGANYQEVRFLVQEYMFSPAPSAGGEWADGTRWYTIHNVRRNSQVSATSNNPNFNNDIYLQNDIVNATSPANWWCFVPDGNQGFLIYNKAFGPDFVLAQNGSNVQMVHKSELNGKDHHYHFDDHETHAAFTIFFGASHSGTSKALNDVGSYLGTWTTDESSLMGKGNGSDFLITRVEDTLVQQAPLFTPCRILSVTVNGTNVPANAGADAVVSFKKKDYACGVYGKRQGGFILVRNDYDLKSVTTADAQLNDFRVHEIMAGGITSMTVATSSSSPAYKTLAFIGNYDNSTANKYVVHRPNGLLWKAKSIKLDGTPYYTVGTQTPDYEEVEMNGRTVYLQKTNTFEVTHFFKPGDNDATQVWFPTTTSSISGANKSFAYVRMFNYADELDNSQISSTHAQGAIISTNVVSASGTTAYANGYVNKNIARNYGSYFTVKLPTNFEKGSEYALGFEISRMSDVGAGSYANGDYADGTASYLCDFDSNGDPTASLTDPNQYPGYSNLLEATISMRQIYHIRSAYEIADSLRAKGSGTDFMEEETIMFPTKNTEWGNFHNVIPLGYNAVDYWGWNAAGTDVFHLNYRSANQGTIKMWAEVVDDGGTGVTINTLNNEFTDCTGLYSEQGGNYANNCRLSCRYVTFKYPSGGVIGDGNTEKRAVIVVKLTDGTVTYNVKRFTLIFTPNTDPIPYDEIIGHDEHSRSDAMLEARYGKPYEEMSFKMPAQYAFEGPGAPMHDMGTALPVESSTVHTGFYQFPIDFGQMSYAHYGGTQWVEWGEYGLRHYSDNNHMVSVNYLRAKYSMPALQRQQAEVQTLLNAATDEVKRTQYTQMLNDAIQAVNDNQARMADEYHNGYTIYCDASEQPGAVAKLLINETLCPGTQFYVTAWMSNGTDYTGGSPNPNSVIFRIKGRLTGTDKYETLAAYCPGQISISVRTKNRSRRNSELTEQDPSGKNISVRPWQQVAFAFTNTAPSTRYDEFRLEVDNNSRGSDGSDFLLDNIRLYVKRPTVEVRDAAPVCGTTLDLVRITTDFDALMEAIKGNTHTNETVNPDQNPDLAQAPTGPTTYYGVYAILDKTVYDREVGDSRKKEVMGQAFMKSLVGVPKIEDSHYDHDDDPDTPHIVDKSIYAFHTIKFYDVFEKHEALTYNDLIHGGEREEAGRYLLNGENALIFNCKLEDDRLKGGDDYMLVFSIQHDEDELHISDKPGTFYIDYFNLGDACRIVHPFSPSSATMVRLDGAQGVDPYKIDFCPGGAPNVTLNSYRYDITTGKLVQEVGVFYDWFYGTLNEYRHENVCDEGDHIDHTLDEALMNFRFFYPDVDEKTLADCTEQHHTEQDGIEYVFTDCMLNQIRREVEEGKLKLRKTNALFDLSRSTSEDDTYNVVAIKLGDRVETSVDAEGNTHYYVYCAEPIELKFYTDHETPGAAIGLHGVDYRSHTPYNVRDKQNNLVSVPTRITENQLRNLRSKTTKKYLKLPLNVMEASGYYQVDVTDGQGNTVAEPTDQIKFVIDPSDNDVVVAETNDPQWQLYDVSGSEFYMPVVGKLKEINAHKARKRLPWLQAVEEKDEIGIDFSDPTITRPFVPREGYYYVLRANFLEEVDEYDGDDETNDWRDRFKHIPSKKFDNSSTLKCHGTILIPLKIVPEYMKWTGRESNDWNNDRNWVRADYRELVPSDVQNPDNAYAYYAANAENGEGGASADGYNGLPEPTNDTMTERDADHPFEGLDIYIPMETTTVTTATAASPYTFGYAPMAETSIIIPTGAVRYPALKAHEKGTEADGRENLLVLDGDSEGNTSIIEYDMVTVDNGRTYFSAPTYEAKPYYENTVKAITFEPGAVMYNSQHLTYGKAWVEYELDANRNYTLSSPLQQTYSGEWYAPTSADDEDERGRQLTPHFYDIVYSTSLNDRFDPAFYQRSWDGGTSNLYRCMTDDHVPSYLPNQSVINQYRALDWSRYYNDVQVDYSTGGFNVRPWFGIRKQADGTYDRREGKVLVRLPKGDTQYGYYDKTPSPSSSQQSHSGDQQTILRTSGKHYRLFTDVVAKGGVLTQTLSNKGQWDNPYYLVGNPFMAPLDMDKFFAANSDVLETGTYWLMTSDLQIASLEIGGDWISTSGEDAGQVAPLQGFFVQRKAGDGTYTPLSLKFDPAMQADPLALNPDTEEIEDAKRPELKARRTAAAMPDDGVLRIVASDAEGHTMSHAAVLFSDNASNAFENGEDVQLLLDGTTADRVPAVFTVAGDQAVHFNVLSTEVAYVPLGVIAPDEETVTTLTFTGTDLLYGVMGDEPHLYDAATGEYLTIEEGQTLTVTGSTSGRYFLVSGMSLPYATTTVLDGAGHDADADLYNLHGIRVASPQHGNVTLRGSRKEYTR